MTLKIPMLTPLNATRLGGLSADWKLGQLTQGRVTGASPTNPTVNIQGTNYQVTSNMQFAAGESLLLKVSGLTPQLEFAVVSRAQQNVGNGEGTSVILSDKFLHNPAAANRNSTDSLISLVSLLHTSSTAPLPPATARLVSLLRSRLMKMEGLGNPKLLESSVQNGGLLPNTSPNAKALNGGLLGILAQIANSLENQKNSAARALSGVKYQQALGMSLYLNADVNSLGKFTRDVEEQYAHLLLSRNRAQEEMQHTPYRLIVDLPVLYKNQVKSLSIRIADKKTKTKKGSDEIEYSVDFEFDFNTGKVSTRMRIITSRVCLSIGCEKNSTVEHLSTTRPALEERLSSYGLTLEGLTVAVSDDYLSLVVDSENTDTKDNAGFAQGIDVTSIDERSDEETRARLHEIVAEGKMPELEEFALQINNKDVQILSQIPTPLYCAMACFFAQLYETELD